MTNELQLPRLSRPALLAWAALALLLAAAGPAQSAPPDRGGVRLIWFTSAHCGPCQQIRPHVERMAAENLPVFKVDTAARPDLMQRYGVSSVPTFVLEVNGEETWRGVGVPGGDARGTAARMRDRLSKAIAANRRPAPRADVAARPPSSRPKTAEVPLQLTRGGAPPEKERGGLFDWLKLKKDEPTPIDDPFVAAGPPPEPYERSEPAPRAQPRSDGGGDLPPANPASDPMRTVVRIQVPDDKGVNLGSGTVIASRPGRSVVVTCGHIFRNLKPGGRIRVESFATGAAVPFEGTLIGFDEALEVGLLSVATPDPLPASAIAPGAPAVAVGDRLVSAGCDGGREPTRQNHLVQSVDKYAGPIFTCTGQPQLGRSGGGCFDAHGRLVGVVWSRGEDPPEGLYMGLPAVFEMLDRHGLTALKPSGPPSAAPPTAAPAFAGASGEAELMEQLFADDPAPAAKTAEAPPTFDPAFAAVAAADPAPSPAARVAGGAVEITCVIRSVEDPSAPSEILVINRATPRTLALLRGAATGEPVPTSLHLPRAPPGGCRKAAGGAAPATACGPAGGAVVCRPPAIRR